MHSFYPPRQSTGRPTSHWTLGGVGGGGGCLFLSECNGGTAATAVLCWAVLPSAPSPPAGIGLRAPTMGQGAAGKCHSSRGCARHCRTPRLSSLCSLLGVLSEGVCREGRRDQTGFGSPLGNWSDVGQLLLSPPSLSSVLRSFANKCRHIK